MESSQIKNIICLVLIFILVSLCFLPVLGHGFLYWDDNTHVFRNSSITSLHPKSIARLFQLTVNKTYIPLTELSYAIEYHFFRLNAFVYHLNNLLLHLCNVLCVFALARQFRLSARSALWAALLFGIHPVHVEPVAWVTGRKDLLYTFFFLISLCCYARYAKKARMVFYILSLIFGMLSVLAKPMALSLPLVLFACDWFWRRKGSIRRLVMEKIPFFLYAIPIAWLTYRLHMRVPFQEWSQAVNLWTWCLVFYIKKIIWPFSSLALYPFPDPNAHVPYLINVIVVACVFIFLRKFYKTRMVVFSFLFYFLTIFFVLRFDSLKDLQVVADRYVYLGSVGFCLLLGSYAACFLRKIRGSIFIVRGLAYLACAGFLLVLCFATFRDARLWGHEEALWKNVIRGNPSSFAHQKLADYYYFNGRIKEAFYFYQRAVQLDAKNDEALMNLAAIHSAQGNWGQALVNYNAIIKNNPDLWEAYANRGIVLSELGRGKEALRDFDVIIHAAPHRNDFYLNRGNVYSSLNDNIRALEDYNKAIQLNPHYQKAYYNRGLAYARLGRMKLAEQDFLFVLKLNPSNSSARINLEKIREARYFFDKEQ